MKKFILSFILILCLFILTGCNNNTNDSSNEAKYSKINTDINNVDENKTENNVSPSENNLKDNTIAEKQSTDSSQKNEQESKEEDLATFSTKIYTKESNRQNNVNITVSTLNGTTVKSGDTFSFCNTVGKATSSKGYEKADVFDSKGNKTKGLGGGNCQVSSTLYNAVLKVPSLQVTERHPHSNNVPYVAKGKDAAVAYGSYDFKFKNNTGNTIKIYSSADKNNLTIRITKIL